MLLHALPCDIGEPGGEHGDPVLRDDSPGELHREDARELERVDKGETRRESLASLLPSMRLSALLPPSAPAPRAFVSSPPTGDSRDSGSSSQPNAFSCLFDVWVAGSIPRESCRTC